MAVDIKKTIQNEFEDLPEDFIVTVLSPTKQYSTLNIEILDYLINDRKMNGIYFTVNKPYEILATILKKNDIDIKKLYFIDAISGVIGKIKSDAENCIIVQNPSALTDLSICITEACTSKNPGFLILDSVSTMLVYNNENATVRFIHYLITELRKCKVSGIILSLEKDMEKKIIDNIVTFCDKVIKI